MLLESVGITVSNLSNSVMPDLPPKIRDIIYGIYITDGFVDPYGPVSEIRE
jgi:hypothetical protein